MDKNLEQQMRKIAQEVYNRESARNQYRPSNVPSHVHNGTDSSQISQNDILPGIRITSGSITFSSATRYTIGVTFNPTSVLCYASALNSVPNQRALCIGNALLGGSYYLQPATSTSVTMSKNIQDITQSCNYFAVDNSVNPPLAKTLASQTSLIHVEYPSGTVLVNAFIESYSSEGIIINVNVLQSGWSIIANLVIQ